MVTVVSNLNYHNILQTLALNFSKNSCSHIWEIISDTPLSVSFDIQTSWSQKYKNQLYLVFQTYISCLISYF